MSEGGDSSGEKTHEPTQQRLDDERRKGNVPKSTDLSAASAYLGLLVACWIAGAEAVESAGGALAGFLARADTLAPRFLGSGPVFSLQAVLGAIGGIAPIFVLPFAFVILVIIAQRAFVFAPEKLKPKLNRISVISQAKNKFGPTGLFEFAKSTTKLIIITTVLTIFLINEMDHMIGLSRAAPKAIPGEMGRVALSLLTQIVILALVISAFDLLWQRFDHARKLRMSHQDLKEEMKKSEGDPHFKSERRRRGEEIALNQMMAEVPDASVVIVNPTHYAVALRWDRQKDSAPVVTAKGVDNVALRIREAAEKAGVPIHRDPPTARALEATAPLGKEIDPSHYKAVAAAIRFAEAMRAKRKERGA